MKELKSKLTGLTQIVTDEEYTEIVIKGVIPINRFIVTELKLRPIITSIKKPAEEIPKEIKITKPKKNEG